MAKSRKGSYSSTRNKKFRGDSKSDRALRNLLKNGRDYSQPSMCGVKTRDFDKYPEWVQIIYTPMGGQNKKH